MNLTHGNKTAIFDAAGKVVWKVDNEDLEGRFADPCGGQLLPNGHVVITSYAQRDPSKRTRLRGQPSERGGLGTLSSQGLRPWHSCGVHPGSSPGASLHEVKGVGRL